MARPLISFVMFAYRQERFVAEAVRGALEQTYSPLEIILSDDCSPDSTYEVIRSTVADYDGPHRVILNRNDANLGLVPHFNRVMSMARGDIVVVAAGDDISKPWRVERSWRLLTEHPDASMISFGLGVIDENGRPRQSAGRSESWLDKIELGDYLRRRVGRHTGASRAFRRSLLDRFPPLNAGCPTEDTPYFYRGLVLGASYESGEVGVQYRVHSGNVSNPRRIHDMDRKQILRQYLDDIRAAARQDIISPEHAHAMRRLAGRDYQRRRLAAGLHHAASKPRYFSSHVLCSRVYSTREKIRMLGGPLVARLRRITSRSG